MIETQKPRISQSATGTIRFPTLHRPAPVEAADARPVHDARELTGGSAQAEILLDGMRYILRITRQGKLILTK